jgi:hypothetical protein
MSHSEIQTLHARCHARLLEERGADRTTIAAHVKAVTRLAQARGRLLTPSHQKTERRARAKKVYTRELDCPIDAARLETLVTSEGDTTWGPHAKDARPARTYRDSVRSLLRHTTTDPTTGMQTLRIRYSYSSLGRDLFEAGHISCSREYADGEDPFKWPKPLRKAAIGHISVTYDDNSAFPRAKMAMTPPVHARIGAEFLKHRPLVYAQYGAYLFSEVPDPAERRKRVKRITNGYDMGSKLDHWATIHGNPHKRSVKDMVARVPHNGGTLRISLAGYYAEQQKGAAWMESQSASMVCFVRSLAKPGTRAWEKAGRTTQSYILQETEAVSRIAKIRESTGLGLRVFNLQHDGIATSQPTGGQTPAQVARLLGEAASAASGYTVVVVDESPAPAVLTD